MADDRRITNVEAFERYVAKFRIICKPAIMAALRYYSNLEDAKTAYPFSEFQRRLCQDKGVKLMTSMIKHRIWLRLIILQEEAATRAMIEKDQEQPQSSRGGRPPKNAKGGGRKPLAQLIGQASNTLHVQQSTVRSTGKENKTKRAIKKKKKGVKVRSQKLQRTNYSQGEAHVRLTEAVKCAEELKTLRVNGEEYGHLRYALP
eukprot:Em0003g539a